MMQWTWKELKAPTNCSVIEYHLLSCYTAQKDTVPGILAHLLLPPHSEIFKSPKHPLLFLNPSDSSPLLRIKTEILFIFHRVLPRLAPAYLSWLLPCTLHTCSGLQQPSHLSISWLYLVPVHDRGFTHVILLLGTSLPLLKALPTGLNSPYYVLSWHHVPLFVTTAVILHFIVWSFDKYLFPPNSMKAEVIKFFLIIVF